MISSVYVHIPFCVRKCLYCDFISMPFESGLAKRYTDALMKEISLAAERSGPQRELKSLFFGGGTPSVLSGGELEGLLDALRREFGFYPDAEITVEANPATADEEKLEMLFANGAGRLSIGAQSFDENELKLLGRAHRAADTAEAVKMARRAGFENISLDLIYGIPGQKMKSWRESLISALRLGPVHISAYELTLEEKTGLWGLVKGGMLEMPPEDEVLAMSEEAEKILEGAGMVRYEVSNYALPGFECRHNLNYWSRGEYLGLGAAAHSFSNGKRWRNTADVAEYINLLDAGTLPVSEAETLSASDGMRELVLLGLRTKKGIPACAFDETGSHFHNIERASGELILEGLLEMDSGRLRATRRGFQLLNSVVFRLLEGLSL